jgi:hypothetical protein
MRKFTQEVALLHAVLEGFFAVNEHYRDFVVETAAQIFIGVHVNFLEMEAGAARYFG